MRPNILFLMTDEQRQDTLSYYNAIIKTPNIDELVKESILFKNAYCSNPSCIPSRAGIVTGKYPTACECPTYISCLPKYEKTFMSKLKDNGYYTAVVGKQHFWISEIDKGYDFEQIVDGHQKNHQYDEIASYVDYLKEHQVFDQELCDHELIIGGEWKSEIKYHIDDFVGNEGKNWLENHLQENSDKPWFFTLSFPGPHQPYDCEGTEFAKLYDLKDMERNETEYEDLQQKPPHYTHINPKAYLKDYSEDTFRRTKRSYYANVSLIDKKIGEVIEVLKKYDQYDNTVIIYSADHGDFMGDYGMTTKAQFLIDSLMRVPLFVKPPVKDFKGKVVEDYVTNINIASTCLSLAGAEHEITYDMENHPFNEYWEKEKVEAQPYLYMEAHDIKAIIEDEVKTIYYVERDYGEIYDLAKDPLERVNLWDDAAYQEHKYKALARIINKLHTISPKANYEWNTNAPRI